MQKKNMLITGGAGFIGANAAHHFLQKGYEVRIFDNLSRSGSKKNLTWLKQQHKNGLEVIEGDVRYDQKKLEKAVRNVSLVLHLAAQVAVTTSVVNPREDFEINAAGTFNVLEAVRLHGNNPTFIYSSTNKVYGGLEDVAVTETPTNYEF